MARMPSISERYEIILDPLAGPGESLVAASAGNSVTIGRDFVLSCAWIEKAARSSRKL
jgi:DNA modification methylase